MKPATLTMLTLGGQDFFPRGNVYYQLSVPELFEHAILRREGLLTASGALVADTGKFTGRAPGDKFIVWDEQTKDQIWWGEVNHPLEPLYFSRILERMKQYVSDRDLYVRDGYVCADRRHSLTLRVITETAYQNIFAHHLFLRPEEKEVFSEIDWTILAIPSFLADPEREGVKNPNFVIINFTQRMVLIGGTGYTGEIKKSIFSVLNYLLPRQKRILPMHCSANVGKATGDTALFFGLSGTGKTTLSADAQRLLVGDDEHGWSESGIFNFEGGCYAKCVGLEEEKEPQIYKAIRFGTLLENVCMKEGSRVPNYQDISRTENTRAAYPATFMEGALTPALASHPKHVFFLTADAFGVLPPISRLTIEQAMYHFISGYTAKVAGTEAGVIEPTATFSACFGKAFLPLHPGDYAALLGEKLISHEAQTWLVNTGWIGGGYGEGKRISLTFTRSLIQAALAGHLDEVEYREHPVFGLFYPLTCPSVPAEILAPEQNWNDVEAYMIQAKRLAESFSKNIRQYEAGLSVAILAAGPKAGAVRT